MSKTIKKIFSVYWQWDLNSCNSQKVGSKAKRRERVYKREAQAQRDFLPNLRKERTVKQVTNFLFNKKSERVTLVPMWCG